MMHIYHTSVQQLESPIVTALAL